MIDLITEFISSSKEKRERDNHLALCSCSHKPMNLNSLRFQVITIDSGTSDIQREGGIRHGPAIWGSFKADRNGNNEYKSSYLYVCTCNLNRG